MKAIDIFLKAFNKIHIKDNITLVSCQNCVDNAKFPAIKHFNLLVKNIDSFSIPNDDLSTKRESFVVAKTINKTDIISLEDVWNEIYCEMIQQILEYYGAST